MGFRASSVFIGIVQGLGMLVCAFLFDNFVGTGLDYGDIVMYILFISFGGFLIFLYPIHLFGLRQKWDAVVVFSSTLVSMMMALFILSLMVVD